MTFDTLPSHPYRPLIERVCSETAPVPANVLEAMVWVESNFNPAAKSASNALGLGQIIYRWHAATVDLIASSLDKTGGELALYDPEVNLRVAARHLRWCYTSDGAQTWERAVRKYFSGSADPPPGFEDGQGTTPDQHISKFLKARLTVERTRSGGAIMAKPFIVLVAGHRSLGDKGSSVERGWTDDLAVAYRQQFTAAGFPVTWVNPQPDGSLMPGGLDALALASGRAIKAALDGGHELVIMFDLHFNTATSPVHAIVPHNRRVDGRGMLASAYVQGRVTDDLAENNTLDVKLAKELSAQIVAFIPGMTNRRDTSGFGIGVMLENETRVGAELNSRLAMMAATAPYRLKSVRLTVEHGGTNDATRTNFFLRCAEAAVRAVNNVVVGRDAGGDTPGPDPEPEPPAGDPGGPTLPAFLFGEADGYTFDPNGPVSKLWIQRGNESDRWPRLVDVLVSGTVKHFVFADGSVIVAESGKPAAFLGEVAA